MKTAVVMFNLGGPDGPAAVRPFLFNLFNDPAIIAAPGPLRWALAQLISRRRAPLARAIYAHLGGASPLLGQTREQAAALEDALGASGAGGPFKCFVAMRYWHPMADETARAVKDYAPERIVLLPLYPQFSTTTTGSSLDDWRRAAGAAGLAPPTAGVCCYPDAAGWIAALSRLTGDGIARARASGAAVRVLFSAHGLPEKIVARGDPYPDHVRRSAEACVAALAIDGLDWRLAYQSRVGPLAWIGPATEDEIRAAGAAGKALVVVPLAFVSEHSETLVELDIEYREVAAAAGVAAYVRVPTVGADPAFIGALRDLVLAAKTGDSAAAPALSSGTAGGACPPDCPCCPLQSRNPR